MPNVVLQVEELLLDALRLRKSFQSSSVGTNCSVEGIVFLYDIAREVALLEQVFVRPTLGVIEHVVGFASCEDVTALWVVQPEQRAESDAVSVDVEVLHHGSIKMHVTLTSLAIPNPVFFDSVPRHFVRSEFVGLRHSSDDFTVVVVLLDQRHRIQNLADAVGTGGR